MQSPWHFLPTAEMGTAHYLLSMTEQQAKQFEQALCQLADVVREVDDTELTCLFDEFIIYASHNA